MAVELVRAVRELRSDTDAAAINATLAELRTLADAGSQRSACTDALAGALLDAQIRAFERRDTADAWSRLDELRARLLRGGIPDLLHDRYAAALFNTYRGGELIDDEPMQLAALEELRTRAYRDPSASASRVALAELLADAASLACRRADFQEAERRCAELELLRARDQGLAIARLLGRALRELIEFQVGFQVGAEAGTLERLRELVASAAPSPGDALEQRLAEALVTVHAASLRADDELRAEALREQLRLLAGRVDDHQPDTAGPLLRKFGKALHDAAVLGLGLGTGATDADPTAERAARALTELRLLVDQHEHDAELRAQLMSALFQVHRNVLERAHASSSEADSVSEAAVRLQAEADALLARDEALAARAASAKAASPAGVLRRPQRDVERAVYARAELRLDHLRMLLATHAATGDAGDHVRAALLLSRARNLVARADAPLAMIEVFAQMLVNAHVDAGVHAQHDAREHAEQQPALARALLLELRELVRVRSYASALTFHLATALFNAHVDAGRRGSTALADRLLAELDQLHRDHPTLVELRRRLVMALVNHHGDVLERQDFARASQLLEQIRDRVRSPDADNHLRLQLAMALGNTLTHADDPACEEDSKRIVSELRVLAAREDASDTLRALVLNELSDRFAPRQ